MSDWPHLLGDSSVERRALRTEKRLTAGYPQIAPQRSVCSNFSSDLSPVTPGLDWLTGNDYFQEAQQQQGKHG